MNRLLVVAFALMVMGHKCDKPKAPHAQAIDAVEEAWWRGDGRSVAPNESLEVAVDSDEGETVVVVFTRSATEAEATLELEGTTFTFVVDDEGEIHERH